MPVAKLRFTALTSETCRLIARAVRPAWMVLPPVLVLLVLPPLAAFGLGPGVVASIPGKVAVNVAGLVAGWLLVLVFARAALRMRTGFDLLRIDRPALMLLGLDLVDLVAGNLPVPHWPAAQLLRSVLVLPATLVWERMTLLLSVAWALGDVRMTIAESWRGLRGNFLRALVFGGGWLLLLMLALLACALFRTGSVRNPVRASGTLPVAVLAVLAGLVQAALPCAITRLLDVGAAVSPPSPGPSPGLHPVAA